MHADNQDADVEAPRFEPGTLNKRIKVSSPARDLLNQLGEARTAVRQTEHEIERHIRTVVRTTLSDIKIDDSKEPYRFRIDVIPYSGDDEKDKLKFKHVLLRLSWHSKTSVYMSKFSSRDLVISTATNWPKRFPFV